MSVQHWYTEDTENGIAEAADWCLQPTVGVSNISHVKKTLILASGSSHWDGGKIYVTVKENSDKWRDTPAYKRLRHTRPCAPWGWCRRQWRGCACTRRSHSWTPWKKQTPRLFQKKDLNKNKLDIKVKNTAVWFKETSDERDKRRKRHQSSSKRSQKSSWKGSLKAKSVKL